MTEEQWPKWYQHRETGEVFRRDSEAVYFWCEGGTTRDVRQVGPASNLDGPRFQHITKVWADRLLNRKHGTEGEENSPPSGVNSDRVVLTTPVPGIPTDSQLEEFRLRPRVSSVEQASDVTLLRQALDGERGEDQKRIAEKGLQIVTTLLRKNRDYGGSAHKRPLLVPSLTARQGILVRLSDKLQRMVSLLEKGSPEVAESLGDTFDDTIGYCMLWLTSKEE